MDGEMEYNNCILSRILCQDIKRSGFKIDHFVDGCLISDVCSTFIFLIRHYCSRWRQFSIILRTKNKTKNVKVLHNHYPY